MSLWGVHAPMHMRPESAEFESAALLLTPYWGRRRVEESCGGGGGGRTSVLELPPQPAPRNPFTSTAALGFWPCPGVSGAAFRPHTSQGWYRLRRERVSAQGRLSRRAELERTAGAAEPLPGEPHLRRRRSPLTRLA